MTTLLAKEPTLARLRQAKEEAAKKIADIGNDSESRTEAINACTALVEKLSNEETPAEVLMIDATKIVMRCGQLAALPGIVNAVQSRIRRFDEAITLIEISAEDDIGNVEVGEHIAAKIKDMILDSNSAVGFDLIHIGCANKCTAKLAKKADAGCLEDAERGPMHIDDVAREPVMVASAATDVGPSNYATTDHDNDGIEWLTQ